MRCKDEFCPTCGERLIHQFGRGINESSSAYGQHIHDDYPQDFYWADIDGVIFKVDTGVLRIIEHKPAGVGLRQSQRTILPMLAAAVEFLVRDEGLHSDSGVFVVNSDHPFDTAAVRRYRRDDRGKWVPGGDREAVQLNGSDLRNFETGHPVSRHGLAAA